MGKVEGGAAKSAVKADKVAEKAAKAKAAEAVKLAKEKAAKQKELERTKAEKAKEALAKANEKAKAKAAKAAEAAKNKEAKAAERAAAKAAKAAAKQKDPEWVEQLDEKGNVELVDKNKFPIEIPCAICNSIRYVTASGALNVTLCKPHARKERRKRRMVRVREKTRNYKGIVKEALEKGLFPDVFKKRHNL